MRIVRVMERSVPLSRYADPTIVSEPLDTSVVAVEVDRGLGRRVTGYGFGSIGRYAQGGLIRERFAPRLLAAGAAELLDAAGDLLDPLRAWDCIMKGEKPGGHGERCVAVGALDMALWDAAAKMAEQPLYRLLARRFNAGVEPAPAATYLGGGYYYPSEDTARLVAEVQWAQAQGYSDVKIKIGGTTLANDLRRIEAVLSVLGDGAYLALDAMNRYGPQTALEAARALAPYRLKWLEDICDPLDYETHRRVAEVYEGPIAAGEALFSLADARNLFRYGGLRPTRDILLFDPAHCYGLPEYLRMLALADEHGWSRERFWPHGGHLFGLHVTCGLGLGGAEANLHNFQPFGGWQDGAPLQEGLAFPPQVPGIGWETRDALRRLFRELAP